MYLKGDALIFIIHLITILKSTAHFLCSHFLTAFASCSLQKKDAFHDHGGLKDNHMCPIN